MLNNVAVDYIKVKDLVKPDRPITYGIVKPGPDTPGGTPLIRGKDYTKGLINNCSLFHVSADIDQAYLRSKLHNGDIIFAIRGSIGHSAIVPPSLEGANITQDTARVSLKDDFDNNYVQIAFNSDYVQNQVKRHIRGATVKGINLEHFREMTVPIPSIDEQKKMALFVEQVDKSRVVAQKAADRYDQLVKSRFVEMFGNLDINDKHWTMSTIGNVAKVPLHYGSTASAIDYNSEIRYVRITDISSDGGLNDDFKSPSEFDAGYLLNKGDILFARSGSIGTTYIFDEDYKSIFAGYLIRFVPDEKIIDPEFAYQFTRSAYCQGILIGSKRGGVQKNVNAKQLSSIPIPLPPMDLQKEFVVFVHQVDKSRFTNSGGNA